MIFNLLSIVFLAINGIVGNGVWILPEDPSPERYKPSTEDIIVMSRISILVNNEACIELDQLVPLIQENRDPIYWDNMHSEEVLESIENLWTEEANKILNLKSDDSILSNRKDYLIWFIYDIIRLKCLIWARNNKAWNKTTNVTMWYNLPSELPNTWKPVIYLYPETITKVDVELETAWSVFFTYPEYNNGWSVTAQPDGVLHDDSWKEYSYIFRDGHDTHDYYDLTEWFVIHRDEVVTFLQDSLSQQWLIPKEYNEFIVYRAPMMLSHPEEYFLIRFADEQEYDFRNPLTITPIPDTLERIYMVFLPLQEKIQIREQTLNWFDRDWFTVVEWWGTDLSSVWILK